ncbi:YbaK/EbsC family protein [Natronomonas sp. EA1]|uniref:YbaK/EbsC family protein n=1 Tax=Natronomonas sp. EA1 TaxID=3421655 RepID=UPI003EC0990E
MHPTAERFAEQVQREYGFDPEVREFPEGTKTAADAAAAIDCTVGQIVKSLVFVASEVVVVLTAGDHRVDEDALAVELGVESVRVANATEVKEATGWSIGGVPPICHAEALPVYLDPTLTDHETIWAAAGTPDAVFALTPDRLVSLADPTLVDAFE